MTGWRSLWLLAALACPSLAFGQTSSLIQSGPTKAGHMPGYVTQGTGQVVVQDPGSAGGSGPGISELGLIIRGTGAPPFVAQGTGWFNTNMCDYDAPIANPTGYHYLCMSPNGTSGHGVLAYGASGAASVQPLDWWINGVLYEFPFTTGGNVVGPTHTTISDVALWANTAGTLLKDGGPLTFPNIGGSVACFQMPALAGDVYTTGGCSTTISAGAVTEADLAPNAAKGNIGALGGVLTGFLPNPGLADMSVGTGKIANGAVIAENIAPGSMPLTIFETFPPNTYVGNASNSNATPVSIAFPDCAASEEFLQYTLGTGVTCSAIGTLGGDLADSTLPNPAIAAAAVTGAKIAAGTITDANIAPNTISYASQNQSDANSVVGNPSNAGANKQDITIPVCSGSTPLLEWVNGTGFACQALLATVAPNSPVRQTVNGPINIYGQPNFWPATSSTLAIGTQATSSTYPLVVTSAQGFGASGPIDIVGSATGLITWSGLPANSTIYCYLTVNDEGLFPGYTTLAPIYQNGGTPSVTNGQFTFNISEMRGYMGNGSTAPQSAIVFVGQVTTNSSTVTTALPYAYNGRFDSGWTATLPTSTAITYQSNIGVPPTGAMNLVIECMTADHGFSVGDEIVNPQLVQSSTSLTQFFQNSLSSGFTMYGSSWVTPIKSGASVSAMTLADWKYKITTTRGWGGS